MATGWRLLQGMLVTVTALLTVGVSVAAAQTTRGDPEPVVVLTGWLDVPADTVVDDAVIFNGDAMIEGTVEGSTVALNGDIIVNGTVAKDVIAVNGRVTLQSGASVTGNVVSKDEPSIAADATVGGRIQRNELPTKGFLLFGRLAFWLAASIATAIFGLLLVLMVPRAADAIANAAARATGASIGFGVLIFIGIPVIGGLALVTLVGALFGIALLAGMVLLYLLAYAAGALALGRLIVKPPRGTALAFVLGWLVLRVLALVPVVGGFLFAATAVWGFGAIAVAARRAGHSMVTPGPALADAGQPPIPPMPSGP
jgi:hypothetical protein